MLSNVQFPTTNQVSSFFFFLHFVRSVLNVEEGGYRKRQKGIKTVSTRHVITRLDAIDHKNERNRRKRIRDKVPANLMENAAFVPLNAHRLFCIIIFTCCRCRDNNAQLSNKQLNSQILFFFFIFYFFCLFVFLFFVLFWLS